MKKKDIFSGKPGVFTSDIVERIIAEELCKPKKSTINKDEIVVAIILIVIIGLMIFINF